MELRFTKMHGAGNDFMVIRWPSNLGLPDESKVRRWANRRMGVGFDQLLLIRPSEDPRMAAFYHVFNADGSEVQQCGNGVRCIVHCLGYDGIGDGLMLDSAAGTVEARLEADGQVGVDLGEPDFEPAALPFRPRRVSRVDQVVGAKPVTRYRLDLAAGSVEFGVVSLGNPHAVIPVEVLDSAPVGIIGPQLQSHPSFPEGVNVGFVEFLDAGRIRLRVFERGAGETAACGTGAAAAVVGRLWGELGDEVRVEVAGGVLRTAWRGPGHAVWLSGPAVRVYEGRIEI